MSTRVGWVEERNPTLSLVNLTVHWAVETAATQTKPACAGFKVGIQIHKIDRFKPYPIVGRMSDGRLAPWNAGVTRSDSDVRSVSLLEE
jgi:hypothetical protein